MANFISSCSDGRLGVEAHGGVRMVQVALDAEPLEFLALHRQPMLGVGAALGTERNHGGGIGEVGLVLPLAR